MVFRCSGVESGDLGASGGCGAEGGHAMFDVFASSRESAQDGFGDSVEVGDAVDDRSPSDAEAAGEFVAEVRFVDVASGE